MTRIREIGLTEARRQFATLIREMDRDPDVRYRILVRNRPVAELRCPEPDPGRLTGIAALLKLSDDIARRGGRRTEPAVTSKNYKEFLYGHWPPARSRKRR